ncbi:hypothetical protein CKM354_000900200 [Cercospora kikuchii]|uniref:BTB domain-containing protein n=1 Tax=Cercospora kikuchii TaxID=84275 RepID=A0A9P3CMC1_9PEZI|nr:uncharacterized protein CKM354_000900200 [Cercospora kikuchii]GIZ45852.1 hypothetical protein CKM354_000900200 [Cercospora kikuchii]
MEEVKDVAPDGDVILVVGADKVKMRVSSVLLAKASPVFKTMFGPHFHDGQQPRGASNPIEIPLPDDSGESMHRLCKMVHLVCEQHEDFGDPLNIFNLAECIDKYCCAGPLRLQSSAILFNCLEFYDFHVLADRDFWSVTSAAYFMDCSKAFKVATTRLVYDTKGEFDLEGFDHLPGSVIGAICEKRATTQRDFCWKLAGLGIPTCDSHRCRNQDQAFMERLANAFQIEYWPPNFAFQPLCSLLATTRALPDIVRARPSCVHTNSIRMLENVTFCEAAQSIEENYQGMCLGCAKTGRSSLYGSCDEHARNL